MTKVFFTKRQLDHYAYLLVSYCLQLKKKEKVLIRSTHLATPLLQALHAKVSAIGAIAEYQLDFETQEKLFYENAPDSRLGTPSPFYVHAVEQFDAIITIRAPYTTNDLKAISLDKRHRHQNGYSRIRAQLMSRAAKKDLRWVLCEYPTPASSKQVNLSQEAFSEVVKKGCFLTHKDPRSKWQDLSAFQERLVRKLNKVSKLHFKGPKIDLSLSIKNRLWINSDGKRNMPSGEVFTSPVESSLNGQIYFSYPSSHQGHRVEGVTLSVKNGTVVSWKAKKGQAYLDHFFTIKGANRFGEVAIGTNPHIQTAICNTLFDEKIAGSIHLALGASYPETGGKNKSSQHWDLITDMRNGGQIFADDALIYKNGDFLRDFVDT